MSLFDSELSWWIDGWIAIALLIIGTMVLRRRR